METLAKMSVHYRRKSGQSAGDVLEAAEAASVGCLGCGSEDLTVIGCGVMCSTCGRFLAWIA